MPPSCSVLKNEICIGDYAVNPSLFSLFFSLSFFGDEIETEKRNKYNPRVSLSRGVLS